jgi:hypothetical protein
MKKNEIQTKISIIQSILVKYESYLKNNTSDDTDDNTILKNIKKETNILDKYKLKYPEYFI